MFDFVQNGYAMQFNGRSTNPILCWYNSWNSAVYEFSLCSGSEQSRYNDTLMQAWQHEEILWMARKMIISILHYSFWSSCYWIAAVKVHGCNLRQVFCTTEAWLQCPWKEQYTVAVNSLQCIDKNENRPTKILSKVYWCSRIGGSQARRRKESRFQKNSEKGALIGETSEPGENTSAEAKLFPPKMHSTRLGSLLVKNCLTGVFAKDMSYVQNRTGLMTVG